VIRLFVAIPLPEAVQDALAGLEGGVPGANWIAPENMHLTLRFIGEVEERRFGDIAGGLAGIEAPDFTLQVAGVDFFGDRRRARLLYAGVRGGEPLARLQKRVESVLVRAGLAAEPRRFHPHVTLARLRDAPLERVGRFLEMHGAFSAPPFPARRFVLFSSRLAQGGAHYAEEAEFPLAAAG